MSLASKVTLYALICPFALAMIALWVYQLKVFRGERLVPSHELADDWHETPLCYGIALADMVIAVPSALLAVGLIFAGSRYGYLIFTGVAFWSLWVNIVTTATSLRFGNPKITPRWFCEFPLGSLFGLGYLVWMFLHHDIVLR